MRKKLIKLLKEEFVEVQISSCIPYLSLNLTNKRNDLKKVEPILFGDHSITRYNNNGHLTQKEINEIKSAIIKIILKNNKQLK